MSSTTDQHPGDQHPQSPKLPRSPGPVGNPMLAFSIALGALVIGVFLPVFLIVAGAGVIWLLWINLRLRRVCDRQTRAIERESDARADAQSSVTLLRCLIDAADIPIVATDASGCVIHTNGRSQAILGIGQAMIGRRFDELIPDRALHELESAARSDEPGHTRLALPIAGEMRQFDVSADPVSFSHGAVLTFRDITELSRAMTLKADFAANASHELRTPIASIMGAAETLSGSARNDAPMVDRLIEMIANNATRLELLACDLLDLSRLEAEDQPAQIGPVELDELIAKVFGELRSQADERELTLSCEIEPKLDQIITDPALLGLILRNLVSNAIKFAHQGTKVQIVVQRASVIPDRTIPIPTQLDRPMGIALEVIDRGIGIPIAHQQRIFERFYQVDQARAGSGAKRGTGLGLAIVKHAARRLGGTISLESVHQVGTTMRIELPRCAPGDDSPDGSASATP